MVQGSTTIDHRHQSIAQSWPEIATGLATSLLLHGFILAIAIISLFWPQEEPEPELELIFEEVELLALGQPRDPDELPRLTANQAPPEQDDLLIEDQTPPAEQTPPPVPEQNTVELQRQKEQEEAKRKEAEKERQRQERQRRMQQALGQIDDDRLSDDIPEGSEYGVAGGSVTDAAMADMMQTFQVRVLQEIQRFWQVPVTLSKDELRQLAGKVRVQVRLAQSGHIVSYRMLSRSSNEQFDNSIERVLQRFERQRGGQALPMPEQERVRDQILRDGIILTNWQLLDL